MATAGVFTRPLTVKTSLPTAALVLINGEIVTVDAKDSIMEGVAVKGGKITDTGIAEKISTYIGTQTSVVALQGKTVASNEENNKNGIPFRFSGKYLH